MLGATVYSASSQWQGDGLEGIRVVPDNPLKNFCLLSQWFIWFYHSKSPFFTTICAIYIIFLTTKKANLRAVRVCFFLNLWGYQATLLLSDDSMFGNSFSWGRTMEDLSSSCTRPTKSKLIIVVNQWSFLAYLPNAFGWDGWDGWDATLHLIGSFR